MTTKKQQSPASAGRRAEIIMKVRAGHLSATEGAALLGVSRKTYYKWENRALEGMLASLEERKTGRPETPEHEQKEAGLKRRIQELEKQKILLEKQMELKDLVHQIKLDEAQQKNRSRSMRSKKKR